MIWVTTASSWDDANCYWVSEKKNTYYTTFSYPASLGYPGRSSHSHLGDTAKEIILCTVRAVKEKIRRMRWRWSLELSSFPACLVCLDHPPEGRMLLRFICTVSSGWELFGYLKGVGFFFFFFLLFLILQKMILSFLRKVSLIQFWGKKS